MAEGAKRVTDAISQSEEDLNKRLEQKKKTLSEVEIQIENSEGDEADLDISDPMAESEAESRRWGEIQAMWSDVWEWIKGLRDEAIEGERERERARKGTLA